jgi:hypothetical protein
MGKRNDTIALSFGQLISSSSEKEKVSLSYDAPSSLRISVIILDSLGRTCLEKQFDLQDGTHCLNFDLSNLTTGRYHAWIDAEGQTFIRSLDIVAAKDNSFFNKLKAWFN